MIHAGLWLTLLTNRLYLRRQRRIPLATPAPKISVLIPARNEAAHLPRLLASLWVQDHPDFEVIVYDDGSTDATPALLAAETDPRLVRMRGEGPPPGWVGKVHALYGATRGANGSVFLFLDADAECKHPGTLRALAERHAALPALSVLTGIPDFSASGGLALVSLVATSVLVGIPWGLTGRLPMAHLGALNGQVWMISAALYRAHEPHLAFRDAVLEDVRIGRMLRGAGVIPTLAPLHRDLWVRMYGSFGEAWAGFRKNAYLILGGRPWAFAIILPFYVLTFVAAAFMSPWLLASLVGLKAVADGAFGLPLWPALLGPVPFALSAVNALDSALAHARGRVQWKGRTVG